MARTDVKVRNIAQALDAVSDNVVQLSYLTAVNGTPGAGQFRSDISGRASVVDLSADILPRMGVERIQTQSIARVSGEIGPNGDAIYKPVSDKFNQIRFGGAVSQANDAFGSNIVLSDTNAFVEIVFYGTGLNVLIGLADTGRDLRATIDGGAESANIYANSSSILNSRNYTQNQIIPVTSGLSLGMHTVKLRLGSANSQRIAGFEILNESSSIKTTPGSINAGGTLRSLSALDTQSYNSTFESGTLGTRGGRVVMYLKPDGTIKKAVNPTGSQLTLTSTDHSNEEVIRKYHWREFGSGRTDDFSTLPVSTTSTRAFTLDDGVTTLTGSNVYAISPQVHDAVAPQSNGAYLIFTFVGTGLDLRIAHIGSGGADTFTASIDGASPITLSSTGVQSNISRIQKIVSGLPYGTHTVKITRTTVPSAYDYSISEFIVYGPKKPSIPAGAVELADYNIMADYVASASTTVGTVSTGVLRKMNSREMTYTGTWGGYSIDVTSFNGGININSTTSASTVSLSFLGTGFEFQHEFNNTLVYNYSITVDGLAMNAGANAAASLSLAATGVTGVSVSAAGVVTGTATGTGMGAIRVTGLPFGYHKVTMTLNNTTVMYFSNLNIITPIHTHKNNGLQVVQNTLSIGSQGVRDLRKFGVDASPMMSESIGQTVNPTTTSVTYVPATDLISTIYAEKDCMLDIHAEVMALSGTGGASHGLRILVDGTFVDHEEYYVVQTTASHERVHHRMALVPVTAGYHTVQVFYRSNGSATATLIQKTRHLKVVQKPL